MGRNYNVRATCTITAASPVTNAPLNIISTAAVCPFIYEINSGCVATPANQAIEFVVNRITAIGSALGAITPSRVNLPAGTAVVAITTANQSTSALPTYTTGDFPHGWAQNQNTAYRWVASTPERRIGLPSTASNGVGLAGLVATASVATWVFNVAFEE